MVCCAPYGRYNMNEPQIPHSLLASKTLISTMEVWKVSVELLKKKIKKKKNSIDSSLNPGKAEWIEGSSVWPDIQMDWLNKRPQ